MSTETYNNECNKTTSLKKDEQKFSNCFLVFMLFIIANFNLANYYIFDSVQSFQQPFREHFGIDTQHTQVLYSVYSFPNLIVPILGGIFVSKFGEKLGTLVFSLAIFIGQVLFTLGIWCNSYTLMVFGRLIFGLGGETLYVAQMVAAEKWFSDKFLS